MTMSFAEQVRAAVASAQAAPNTEPAQRYQAVLNEFIAGLKDVDVGARIKQGRDPRKLTFYLFPLHRPARVNLMLTFFLNGEGIVVSGENPTPLNSPEELQRWLLTYVQSPTFVESLNLLRQEAEMPVEARLRVDSNAEYAAGDVLVAVTPTDQERLDNVGVGSEVELVVERVVFPGNRQFADPPRYAALDSAGLFVTIDESKREGENLRIKGKRTA
jgi:hypothetical protein